MCGCGGVWKDGLRARGGYGVVGMWGGVGVYVGERKGGGGCEGGMGKWGAEDWGGGVGSVWEIGEKEYRRSSTEDGGTAKGNLYSFGKLKWELGRRRGDVQRTYFL